MTLTIEIVVSNVTTVLARAMFIFLVMNISLGKSRREFGKARTFVTTTAQTFVGFVFTICLIKGNFFA